MTSPRTRPLAPRRTRGREPRSRPGWTVLAGFAVALAGSVPVARGQGGPTASDAVPPATARSAPAEIQPGHPARGQPVAPAAGGKADSPQTAVPAPLPPGSGADTPGGSARDGVIRPPAAGDTEINKGAPAAGAGTMPVIPPPGAAGGSPQVVPK